ncbi:MAG TPA: S41 family peptidase [Parafilimonas sp.]|nr:S41 family peptidase [Parafilimonas sp.]
MLQISLLNSKVFIAIIALFLNQSLLSQTLTKAASNAFTITRMVEKFHIQPRVLNDSLSNDFFNRLMKQLDEERIYFNQEDVSKLSAYRFRLDEEIKQMKSDFLKLIANVYTTRLHQADTLIDVIAKKPFDFSSAEKFTLKEDTSCPAGIVFMHTKLYKRLKLDVLNDLLDFNDSLSEKDQSKLKRLLDSAQTALQKKAVSEYKRNITGILQSPGGVDQFIADEYCKALASCYDPHTEFLPLTEEENFETKMGNERFRFGFAIKDDNAGGVLISELEPGSPAFKSGLLNKGDKFQALQWEGQNAIDVSDADVNGLTDIFSQSNHDTLTITVQKADGTLRTVSLLKEQAKADNDTKVKSFLLKANKTFGYISLPAFYNNWEDEGEDNNGCANDVAKEILKLKNENISGLILDLRYNGGGSIQEAVELTGIFIDAGPVAQIKTRTNKQAVMLKDINRGTVYDGPLLILVNGYSASASELVAGSLQDYNRALIVGSPTYGKATGQLVLPLDTAINIHGGSSQKQSDYYIKITMDKLYRINGSTAQFTGVKPDIALPDFLQADPQGESNQPFALPPTMIDAIKYYKPYPALPLTVLQSVAKQDVDTIRYFTSLETYIRQYQMKNVQGDMSLNWDEALAEYKEDAMPSDLIDENYTSTYSVQNNAYDAEKLKSGGSSTGINETFIRYLSHDPYVKISCDLLDVMAK